MLLTKNNLINTKQGLVQSEKAPLLGNTEQFSKDQNLSEARRKVISSISFDRGALDEELKLQPVREKLAGFLSLIAKIVELTGDEKVQEEFRHVRRSLERNVFNQNLPSVTNPPDLISPYQEYNERSGGDIIIEAIDEISTAMTRGDRNRPLNFEFFEEIMSIANRQEYTIVPQWFAVARSLMQVFLASQNLEMKEKPLNPAHMGNKETALAEIFKQNLDTNTHGLAFDRSDNTFPMFNQVLMREGTPLGAPLDDSENLSRKILALPGEARSDLYVGSAQMQSLLLKEGYPVKAMFTGEIEAEALPAEQVTWNYIPFGLNKYVARLKAPAGEQGIMRAPRSTEIFLRLIDSIQGELEDADVLQVGTTKGAITSKLARHSKRVVGLDIYPLAVENTKYNLASEYIGVREKALIGESNLDSNLDHLVDSSEQETFEGLGFKGLKRFDRFFFNNPIFEGSGDDNSKAGHDYELVRRTLRMLPNRLNKGGKAYMLCTLVDDLEFDRYARNKEAVKEDMRASIDSKYLQEHEFQDILQEELPGWKFRATPAAVKKDGMPFLTYEVVEISPPDDWEIAA